MKALLKSGTLVMALLLSACDGTDVSQSSRGSADHANQGKPPQKGKSGEAEPCKAPVNLVDSDPDLEAADEAAWTLTESDGVALLADPVTYDGQISKLLTKACVNCHKPGGDRPDLSTYALAKQGGPSSLSSINRNRMPTRTPLAQEDKDLFKAWADGGYLQSTPPQAPAPVPAPVPPSEPMDKEKPSTDPSVPPPEEQSADEADSGSSTSSPQKPSRKANCL